MFERNTTIGFIVFVLGALFFTPLKTYGQVDTSISSSTLFDMKSIPSDYECLLLASHAYQKNFKEGARVICDKAGLFDERDGSAKVRSISYLFLIFQLIAILGFLGLVIYDFLFYLERNDTWLESLDENIYLLVIGIIKIMGVGVLLFDLPLIFNKNKGERMEKVYSEKDLKTFYEKGWRVLKVFTSELFREYKSILYINAEETKLVLGLQGSSTWRDWFYTNWPAVMHQQPKGQVKLMLKLIEGCIAEAKKYKIDVLTITGHSLGGFLTQICTLVAAMHFDHEHIHVRGITYDSPGAKSILETINCNTENNHIDLSDLDITNYVSSPNLINAMHDHTGSLYMTSLDSATHQSVTYRFPILFVKLLFYLPLSVLVQVALLFAKKILDNNSLKILSDLSTKILYYLIPIPILLMAIYLIYAFHYKWLGHLKNALYSWDHHMINNFVKASDPVMGTIKAVEVSYFPKYGQMHQGPGELFLELLEKKKKYRKNIKEGPIGICYVKSDNNTNARFLPMRHLLPEVREFLQQLDRQYVDNEARDSVLRLLGMPGHCRYDSRGVLLGIQSTKKGVDAHMLMDSLAILLRKNNCQT